MRRLFSLLLLAACVTAFFAPAGAVKKHSVTDGDARKADLLFLEALKLQMEEKYDATVELLSRAHELNPEDKYVGSEYGFMLIRLGGSDTTVTTRGYNLMKDYAATEDGNDYYNRARLAQVAALLGKNEENLNLMRQLYLDYPERPEVAGAFADRLMSSGNPDRAAEALAVYDTLEVREGGLSLPLLLNRIRIYATANDSAAVVSELRRGLKTLPPSAEVCLFAGQVFEQYLSPDSSFAYYDRAVELDPDAVGIAYYYRANLLLNKGDSIGYDREIFKALNQPDLDINIKLELLQSYVGNLYTDPQQKPRILALFENIVERHPHEAEVHGFYADYLSMIGDFDKAAPQTVLALDLNPDDNRRWRLLTSIYMQLKNYDQAVKVAKKGLHYFPEDDDLVLLGATAYSLDGHTQRALDMVRPLVDKSVGDAERQSEIFTTMGDIFYKGEQNDSAFVYYGYALGVNPENMLALNNCAYHLACQGRELPKALEMIEKVVKAKPDDATSLDTYAWVLFKMREYDRAREIIDKTIDNTDEPSAEVLQHAGDIYFMCQLHDEAVEFWEEALELDPGNELLQRKVNHKTYFPQ